MTLTGRSNSPTNRANDSGAYNDEIEFRFETIRHDGCC